MMKYGLKSIIGKVREKDEDSIFVLSIQSNEENKNYSIAMGIVADGMGGGERGEIASSLAVKTISNNILKLIQENNLISNKIEEELKDSIKQANDKIKKYKIASSISEMGTTVTLALVISNDVYVANVGDSRTYLISSEGKILEKTKDHSYVQELVDNGMIKESEVRKHPNRNIITRVLDGEEDAIPDIYHWKIYKGEYLLLCCDGLWESLEDDVIGKTLILRDDPQEIVDELIELANELDGSDNISAILLKQMDDPEKNDILNVKTRRNS